MREMKDSGIPWIGEIPKEWETARIKDVVRHLKSGGTPETANDTFYCETGTPWVAIGDMRHGGFIEDTQKHLTENGINSKSLIVYPQGTLLYSIYASIGKVSILKIPAAVNQAILAISLNEKYNELYAKYVLMALEDYVFSFANGNTQFNLNANIVSNLPIPLLPPTEQQAIAEFLDRKCAEVDEMISLQERIIEELKAYKQSVITEAVTKGQNPDVSMKDSGIEWIGEIPEHWEVRKLSKVFSFKGGYAFNSDDFKEEGDKQVIRIGNIRNDLLRLDVSPVYISNNIALKAEKSQLEKGQILFTMTGTKGKRDYFYTLLLKDENFDGKELYLNQRVGCFAKKDGVCAGYYNYLLKDSNILDSIFIYETGTANQGNLGIETIKRTMLQYPPEDEQQSIADYLDNKCADIDSLIQTKQSKIDSLKEYKKSIIYEYVTGKREVE